MVQERLHKVMAACGVASRRKSEAMIADGRVTVDGEVVTTPGTLVDVERQEVRVDDQRLRARPRLYFLLNKPRGVICSQVTEPGKRRAIDYVPDTGERLFTVGRLDVDSEGAIILTNDGDLTHLVTHPRFGIDKEYLVEVEGRPSNETIAKMRKGVWLSEGRTGSLHVRVLKRTRHRTRLAVRLEEGMKREIRRVCARLGHEVVRLRRVAIGPVRLGRLPTGRVRRLTREEVDALQQSARTVIRLGGPRAGGRPRRRSRASRPTGRPHRRR